MQNVIANSGILEEINVRKQKRKFSFGLIILMMMLALVAVVAYPSVVRALTRTQVAVSYWTDGLTAQALGTETWAGTGTESDAYMLASATDLAQLAVNVNSGVSYAGKYFELTTSLNLAYKEWVPIGTLSAPFEGTFDGGQNKIYYMTITGSYDVAGLFGYANGGAINNVAIVNTYINVNARYTGSVAGHCNNVNVSDCSNDMVDSAKIGILTEDDLHANASGISNLEAWLQSANSRGAMYTGGNTNEATNSGKSNLRNSSTVSGSDDTGGIIGFFQKENGGEITIQSCWNTGNVTCGSTYSGGGIIGWMRSMQVNFTGSGGDAHARMYYCANAGKVSGGGSSPGATGGLVGYFHARQDYGKSCTAAILQSYNLGDPSTGYNKGGIYGKLKKEDLGGGGSPFLRIAATTGGTSSSNTCYYTSQFSSQVGPSASSLNANSSSSLSHSSSPYTSTAQYKANGYTYTLGSGASETSGINVAGWGWSSSNWNKVQPTGSTTITFIANYPGSSQWSANSYNSCSYNLPSKYTITLNKNSGSGGTSSIQSYSGEYLSVSSLPTRTGYQFDGYWTTSSGGTQYIDEYGDGVRTWSGTSNTTLYAHWIGNTYYVSYNKNGGSGTTMSTSTFTYGTYDYLRDNTYYRSGYRFAGWAKSSGGSVYYDDGERVRNLTTTNGATVTLYAVWELNTITITASASGANSYSSWTLPSGWSGSGTTASKVVNSGSSIGTLPTPTRTGYNFKGWYTTSTGSTQVTSSSSYTSDKTIYAQWTARTYTVTLNNQSATTSGSTSVTATYGSAMPSITLPTKTHYVFDGYYTSTNGSGTQYYTSSGGSSRSYTTDGTMTLYAYWQPATITVSYNANGGSAISSTTSVKLGSTFGSFPTTTRTGYTFEGWYYNSSLSTASRVTTSTTLTESMLPSTANTLTLYANWTILQYVVTLQANDAVSSADLWTDISGWNVSSKTAKKQFTYGDSMPKMPTPSRLGYNFTGWFTATSGGTKYVEGSTINFASATTLYAQWSAIGYTLTINANGGSLGSGATTIAGTIGQSVTISTATRTGYNFSSWSLASGTGTINGSTFVFGAGSAEIIANWTAKTYTLTFNKYSSEATWEMVSGFTPSGDNYTKTVTYDQPIGAMPTVRRTGWQFSGWFNSSTSGTLFNENTVWTFTTGVTLYAQYSQNSFTLTIDKANGETLLAVTKHYGEQYTLPSVSRTGYQFSKWEKTSGEGTLSGGVFTFGEGNALITAIWTANIYYIAYDSNGGTGSMTRSQFTYDVSGSLRANAFTRTGYQFSEWNTQSNGQGTTYMDRGAIYNLTSQNNASITLYAIWTSIKYTVIYDGAGGIIQATAGFTGATGKSTSSVVYTYGTTFGTLPTVTLTGYDFVGWVDESDKAVSSSDTVTGNITIRAKFKAKTFTLTLDALNGVMTNVAGWTYTSGNKKATKTIAYDDLIGELPVPTLAGSTFSGWFTSASLGDQYTAMMPYKVVGNLTLVPHYSADFYVVSFDGDGGVVSVSQMTVQYNSTIGVLPTVTRQGYRFVNWYDIATGTAFTATTRIVSNMSIKARWEPLTFIVTFDGNTGTLVSDPGYTIVNNKTSISVEYDSTYPAFPGVTKAGASFIGWYDNAQGTGQQYTAGSFVRITSNITLYAVFRIETYTVLFNANGGAMSITSKTFEYDTAIGALPVPTLVGHAFLGWTVEQTGTNYINSTFKVKENTTLFAQYSANTYKIAFNKNYENANGTMSTIDMAYGQSVELPTNNFTSNYAIFIGWATNSDGSGQQFSDGQIVSNLTETQGQTITLYALWSLNTYTVTIVGAGGTFSNLNGYTQRGITVYKDYGYNVALGALPTLTVYGYDVTGYKNSDTGAEVNSSTRITQITQLEPILVAKQVTITYKAGEGVFSATDGYVISSDKKTATITKDFGKEYAPFPNTSRTGYTLSHFRNDANGDIVSGQAVIKIENNINLTAQYDANAYTLILDANGGIMTYEDESFTTVDYYVSYDEPYGDLLTPTRTGYTFDGWNTRSDGEGTKVDSSTIYNKTSNTTIYAKWIATTSTLTIDPNGGYYEGLLTTTKVDGAYDEVFTFASSFRRAGYTFMGLEIASGDGVLNGDLTNGFTLTFRSNDTRVVAQWEAKQVIVKFEPNGGSFAEGQGNSLTAVYDQRYGTLPTPTRQDYTFAGWYRDNGTFANAVLGTDIVKDEVSEITLYANWTDNDYTLRIDANGGEYTGEKIVAGNAGEQVTVFTPTRTGYIFNGWTALTIDGYTGTIVINAGEDTYTFTFGSGNGSILAQWTPIQYTIVFDKGTGESGSTASLININYGSSAQLTANGFKKTGYTFTGWLWNGISYGDRDVVMNLVETDGATLTFVAQWTIMQTRVQIDPNAGLYEGMSSIYEFSGNYGDTIPIANPTRYGFTFTSFTHTGKGILNGNKTDGYTFTFGEEDGMLRAEYLVNKIIVTFDPMGIEWKDTEGFTVVGGKIQVEATYGDKYGIIPTEDNLNLNGMVFNGWRTEDGVRLAGDNTVEFESDITLYLDYEKARLTLTIFPNGGIYNDTQSATEYTGKIGDEIEIVNPTRTGYTFDHWEVSGDGTLTAVTGGVNFVFATANTTLTAVWKPNNYILVFDANGGQGTMISHSMTYDEAWRLDENAFTREGYDFVEWNASDDGSGQGYSNRASVNNLTTESGGVYTLYAQWQVHNYVVNFDANSGQTAFSMMNVDHGDPYGTLPTATRTGYEFLGWFTSLEADAVLKTADDIVTENHTLYAHWKAISYTITFDAGEGEIIASEDWTGDIGGKTTTKVVDFGDKYDVLPVAKHATKRFVGWFTATHAGTQIQEGLDNTTPSDQTFYAHYSNTEVVISFDANGGTLEYSIVTLNLGDHYEFPEVSRTGYDFAGWYLDEQLVDTDTIIENSDNHTLVAHWTPLEFTLTFDFAGGTYVATDGFLGQVFETYATLLIKYGEPYGVLPTVVLTGYRFDNWLREDGTQIYATLLASYLEDFTVTADFKIQDYDLVINPNGGKYDDSTETTTITNNFGTEIILLTPTRFGYNFVGFENQSGVGNAQLVDGVWKFVYGAGNTTLIAKWQPKLIYITFDAGEGKIVGSDMNITADGKRAIKSYLFDDFITAMPSASLEGNRFDGWFMADGLQVNETTKVANDENFTVYASYKKITYYLNINPNNGEYNGTGEVTVVEGRINDVVTVVQPTRVGYDFENYVFSGAGQVVDNGDGTYTFTFGEGNSSLSARWTPKTYVVTFDYAGATSDNTVDHITVTFGSRYGALPTPKKTGYDFRGWFTEAEDGELVQNLQNVERAEDHTLYAHWELKKWTLRVLLDGGEIDGTSTEYVEFEQYFGQAITFSVPTKYGYDFDGFNKRGDAGQVDIDGNVVTFTFGESDVTLVTLWKAQVRKVTLDAGEEGRIGDNRYYEFNVTFGQIYGMMPVPTRFGYVFADWQYADGESVIDIIASMSVQIAGDHTLVAHYEKIASTLTVLLDGGTLEVDDEIFEGSYQVKKHFEQSTQLPEPTRDGYEFARYRLTGEGELVDNGNGIWTYTFGAYDATITAIWRPQTIQVELNAGVGLIAGVEQNTQVINVVFGDRYDGEIGEWPDAYLFGYQFDGWYLDDELIVGSNTVKVSTAHTLTAKFTQLQYTLTVELNGSTIMIDGTEKDKKFTITQTASSTYMFENNPQLRGHTFTGFTLESGKGTISASGASGEWVFEFADGDATIVANFTPNKYTLTMHANELGVSIPDAPNGEWTVSSDGSTATKQVTFGEKIGALPTLTKSGSNFMGWWTRAEDGAIISEIVQVDFVTDYEIWAHWNPDKFSLTIELGQATLNDGTQDYTGNYYKIGTDTQEIIFNYTITNTGHKFTGFRPKEGSAGTLDCTEFTATTGEFKFTFGAGNAAIVCDFEPNVVKVILSAGEGEFEDLSTFTDWTYDETSNSVSRNYSYGEMFGDYPVVKLKGNVFTGWFDDETQYIKTSAIRFEVAEKTLVARTARSQYTLVINTGGGFYDGQTGAINVTKKYKSEYTVVKPTRTGYVFDGWEQEPNTVGEGSLVPRAGATDEWLFTFGADTYTIIAKWKQIQYEVEFDINCTDGSGNMDNQVVLYDESVMLNANVFVRPGYLFTGWMSENGTNYHDRELIRNLSYIQDDVITMHAQWEVAEYNIYYDANNGTARPIVRKVKYLAEFGQQPTATRHGYTLAGWYEAIDASGNPVGNPITETDINNVIGDRTLIAYWKINYYNITLPEINPEAAVLEVAEGDSTRVIFNGEFKFTIDIKEPYNQSRLIVRANGLEVRNVNNVYLIARIDEDITITIEGLEINKYRVYLDTRGGSVLPPIVVEYGNLVPTPTTPTRPNYDFTIWYADSALTQEFDFANVRIYQDITLYAGYEVSTYQVTFYWEVDGQLTVYDTQSVKYLEYASSPTRRPSKNGYEFIGWFENDSAETEFNFNSQITGDLNLYARFSTNTFIVSFYNGNKLLGEKHVNYGAYVTPYDNTNLSGYEFIGWYKDIDCLVEFDFENTRIVTNTSIYAKYEILQYSVYFYVDGVVVDTKVADYGSLITPPTVITNVPEGYHIVSWYTNSSLLDEFVYNFNTPMEGTLILYGKYIKDTIYITVDIAGALQSVPFEYGDYIVSERIPILPSRVGYTQVAPYYTYTDKTGVVWKLVADELGTFVYFEDASGNKMYLSEMQLTESIELTAVYTLNVYTITFIMPDKTQVVIQINHGEELTKAEMPKPKTKFGDIVSYDQNLSNIQGNMVVNVKIKNYIRIPLIIVGALLFLIIATVLIILAIKSSKKKSDRSKIKELIDTRGN